MTLTRTGFAFIYLTATLAGVPSGFAQESFIKGVLSHNARMAKIQPPMITPLVAPDPRLVQYVKLSFANQYTNSGTQTVSFGNARGIGLVAGDRFEFDFIPPSYIEHNSKAMDGFGDFSSLVKYRILSRNAKEGNYILTAILARCFATASYQNGAATDSYAPAIVFAKAFRNVDAISSVGGTLPTDKVQLQGRSIVWNEVIQMHATRAIWFELENNAAFWMGGTKDGHVQNFLTPAAFYVIRRKEWKPTHPFFIIDGGMQIASTHFHPYNHNLISELRILF